jgi:hypothetical protein
MVSTKRHILRGGGVVGASLALLVVGGMLAEHHRAMHFPAEAVATRVEPDGTLHLEITIRLPPGMSARQAEGIYPLPPSKGTIDELPRRRIAAVGDLDADQFMTRQRDR